MGSLTDCLRRTKVSAEDAAEIRAAVREAAGDERAGVIAYLTGLYDDAADLRGQLEEAGFDFAVRTWGETAQPTNGYGTGAALPPGSFNHIGVGLDGHPMFQNNDGIRSKITAEDGRIYESFERDADGKPIVPTQRSDEWLTREEIKQLATVPQPSAAETLDSTAPAPAQPTTEAGAEGLPQFVIPGTEQSAIQAQAARDDKGGKQGKGPQKAADEGLFAAPEDTRQTDIEGVQPPVPAGATRPNSVAEALAAAEARDANLPDNVGARKYLKAIEKVERLEKRKAELNGPDEVLAEREAEHAATLARIESEKERGWEHRLQVEKEQFNKWRMERRNDRREALKRLDEDLRWAKDSVRKNKPEYDRWLAAQPKAEAAPTQPEPSPVAKSPAQPPPGYGGTNTAFTSDAAERARAIIRAKLNGNQLNSGFDPELMMAGLQLAGYHVEAGARSFTAYAKAMVDDMGAAVGPYLKQWYNAVRDHPGFDATGMTPYEIVAGTDITPFTTSAPAVTEPAAEPAPQPQTAEPEPTETDQPRTAAQKTPVEQLAEHGLVLSEKTSRAGKTYWAVTGDTQARKDALDAVGFGTPFKMEGRWWRSYHKGDPTQALLQALGLAEAPPPAAPIEITQEHRDRLRNAKLRLGQTKGGIFLVTGDTYDVKDLLRDAGGRFNKAEGGWEFIDDPTARIATALAGRDQGAGAGQDGADNADAAAADAERERLEQLRREQDARPDERALGLDVEGQVAPETRDLLRAGLKYGIPVEVVDDQIEDVALIASAYQKQKPLFLLANEAGTGKTFVLGGAIRELRRQGARKFVYVTMNQDLIEQIKRDLAAYGVDDVTFRTYSELSGARSREAVAEASGAVVIFDESHNVKNVAGGTARADVGQIMAGQARFTIFSSATPFENPVQARYLQATGIFDQVGGFDQWAKAYGASVRRRKFFNTNTGRKEIEEIIYWSGGKAKRKEAAAARVWMFRQGIMTQRSMRLDPAMVDASFVKEKVEQRYVDMYNAVDEAYGRALNEAWGEQDEEGVGEGVDPALRAEIARHRENTIKRLLEAAKIPFAIARAKAHHARGRSVVIFVETKADRELGRFRRSQHFKDDTLYSYPEMLALMDEYFYEKAMAKQMGGEAPRRPFADFILRIARNFHEAGINYQLPSTAEEITAALGGVDKVAQYHGGVTDSRARKDKAAFLAGEKPFLVATMAKGGTGLSLHDTKGNRPTSQVNVNLPWVAQQVDQVSGRVARYGLQSRAEIEWIFSENIPWESSVLAPKIAGRMSDMGAVVKGIQTRAADALADFDFTGTISVKGSATIDTDAADPTATGPYAEAFRHELSRGQPMDTRNGFFETPYPLSMLMARVSGATGNDRVLEPSAGHGSLLRYLPAGAKVTAVELRPDNASVLRVAKGNAQIEVADFRDWSLANPNARFDTIVMNPPFERIAAPVGAQDIWHVQQAYEHLAPGGRLVAVMGEGAFFRSYKQEMAFRQWLDDVGATVVRLPEGSFRSSGTMVRARMVVIDRDGAPGRSDINLSDLDADSLLAIEAEIPTRRQVEPSADLVEAAKADESKALEVAPRPAQDDSPADALDLPTPAQVEADDAAAAEPEPEVEEPRLPLDDSPVPPEKKVKLSDRIEDAGEKIGGARKDLWAGRAITLADLEGMNAAEEQQFIGKEAVWPKMDYAAMVGAGADPEAVALVKIIRDRLAAKPEDSAEGRRNYIRMLEMVRDAAAEVKTVADAEAIRDRMHKALGYPESFQARTSWSREERRAFNAVYQSIQKEGARQDPLDIGFDERSKARAMVRAGFPGEMKPWQKKWSLLPPTKYGIKSDSWAIVETAARRIIAVDFATEEEAAAAADKLWAERTKKDGERLPERPHLDVLQRTGADVRGGRDIDSPDFLTDFGFRAVEFGNWVAGDERQKIVNLAYEGLHDLARALNLPPMALSLDGTMALAFGARGKGSAKAHYEPGRMVINMTKLGGAGSLAHEWAHALDHYLGELERNKGTKGEAIYASGGDDRTSQRTSFLKNLRPELAETIDALMRAIYSANKTKAERVREQELKLEKQVAENQRVRDMIARQEADRDKFAANNPSQRRQYDKTIQNNQNWLARTGEPVEARIRQRLAELREMPEGTDFGMTESSFYEEAKKLSGKSGEKGYWARPTELWARALEAYVFDRIGAEGNVSQYLVQGVEGDRYAKGFKGNPYPAGIDRERIGKAFDALFAELKVRTGQTGKPALYALPRFYSALHRAVTSYPAKGPMPALQWLGIIRNMKGIKPAEITWSGVEAWLETRGGKVTRDEIGAFLKASEPDVSEKVLGAETSAQARILDSLSQNADRGAVYEIIQDAVRGDTRAIQELRDMDVPQVMLDRLLAEGPQTFANNRRETAKYEDYTVPGAENYREVLLQMPAEGQWPPPIEWRQRRGYEGDTVYEDDGNNVVIRALQNGRFLLESPGGLRDLYPSLDAAKRRAEEMIDHIDGRRLPDANPNAFVGAHWDNNFNVVLHLRLSDRVDANGRRTLFVEEVQSDWHREGRKHGYVKPGDRRDVASVREKFREYAKRWSPFAERRFGEAATANSLVYQLARNTDPEVLEEISNAIGMPWLELQEDANLLHDVAIGKRLDPKDIDSRVLDAPFKDEWAELGMKTAIRMAVEGGYDAVGWAPGKVHKDRYSLAKQVNWITYDKEAEEAGGGYSVRVRGFHGRDLWVERGAPLEQIEKMLGKDVAEKIRNGVGQPVSEGSTARKLSGLDLEMGGEWADALYDRAIPRFLDKFVKPMGGKVGTTTLSTGTQGDRSISAEQRLAAAISGQPWVVYDPAGNEVGRFATEGEAEGWLYEGDVDAQDRPAYSVINEGKQVDRPGQPIWTLPITDGMRETVQQVGLPLWARSAEGDAGDPQYRLTPAYQAQAKAVIADLEARLKAVGLGERIALAVRENLTVANDSGILELEGRYFRGLIEVALNRGDQTWTLNHEIVHAMRDLGIIRDAEWATLERAVRADTDRMAEVWARYGQAGNWSEEQLVEEAIADMFADWVRGRSETRGFIQSAFDRIRAFFEALRAALTGKGFTTPEQIFRQIDTGRMGRRRTAEESALEAEPAFAMPRLRRGVDRLVADAQSMASWKDWYQRHQDVLKELFDGDADLFQSLLSATSQMATVKSNVGLALKAYQQLKTGQPFTGYLPAVTQNLDRIAAQQRLAGPKISAYGDANTGEKTAVAVDRHVSELLFGTKVPTRGMIRKGQETVARVARKLGWEPRQAQAALWAANQVRKGMDPANVQSYDAVLLGKKAAIDALRSSFNDAGGAVPGLRGRGDPGEGAAEGARGDQARRRGQNTSADAILGELRRRRDVTIDADGRPQTMYRGIGPVDGTRLPGETWTDSEAVAAGYADDYEGGRIKRAKINPRNPLKLDSYDDGFVDPDVLFRALGLDWETVSRENPGAMVYHEDHGHIGLSLAELDDNWDRSTTYFEAWRLLDDPYFFEKMRAKGYDAATYWGPFTDDIPEGYAVGSYEREGPAYTGEVRIIDPAIVKPVTVTAPTSFDVKAGKPQPGRAKREKARRRNATRAWHQLQREGVPTPRYALPRVGARQGSLLNYDLLGTIRAMGAENHRWIAKAFGRKAAANTAAQIDLARHRFQDRFIRVRRLQEAAERILGRPLTEAEQAYLAEEGFASKVGERKFRIDMDYKLPIAEAMKAAKLTIDEVDAYLMARHAKERNEQIASINPRMPDSGSGMSTADAKTVLDTVAAEPAERRDALERIAGLVDGLLADALAWKVESGLLAPEAAQNMRAKYSKYVPLRGVPEDPDAEVQEVLRPVTGVGFMGSRRKERRAFGRPTPAQDVLATALTIADEAAVRGEKNIVAQALLNLVRNVPDERVWEVNPGEMRAYLADETYEVIDPATGRKVEKKRQVVRYRRQPHYSPRDTVAVFVGGREFRIQIKDPLLLREIERMGGVELNAVLQRLSQFTQTLSRLNTGWNIEFVVTNLFRDIQSALVNISAEDQAGIRRDMLKNWRAARKGYFHYTRTGKTDTPMAALAQDFRAHGGAVSYNQTTDVEQQTRELEELMATFRTGTAADVWKNTKAVFKYFEDVNNAVDAGIRLSTYKALVDRGYSKAKAASVAKNLTVNFNRRGEYGSALNAFFMFYNAATQGTAVMLSAMKHPKVQAIVLSAVAFGAAQEMLYGLLLDPPDEDDDEEGLGVTAYERIPEFLKQRNLILLNPWYVEGTDTPLIGTPYFTIPMPLGYNLFHNIGRTMAAYARGARDLDGKQMSMAEATSNLMRATADSVLPTALSGYLVPTFAQPFVDVARNEDFFERPIMPTRMPGDNRPDSELYYPTVSAISRETAQALNRITGGSEWQAGLIDVSPEAIDHVAGTYAGAAGSLAGHLINRGWMAGKELAGQNVQDPEFGIRDIPFLRKLFGYNSPGQQRDATYQRMAVVEALVDEAKSYADPKNPNPEALADLKDASGPLLLLKDDAGKLREFLANSRRRRIAIAADEALTPAERRDQLNTLAAAEQLRMRGFNLRYMEKVREMEER